jgi:tetratricopeptide (TPR) repeat protein
MENSNIPKPDSLLAQLEPKKSVELQYQRPGYFRTILTIFMLSTILTGGAAVTSWLVFRQAGLKKEKQRLTNITAKTKIDTPSNYINAIEAISKNSKTLGNSKSLQLLGRFSLFMVLSHDDVSYLKYATDLDSYLGKRLEHRRKLFKSAFLIAKLIKENRYKKATLETEKALTRFPRSHMHLYELAIARIEMGNWEAAHSSLMMAIELSKRRFIPYLSELASLERRRGHFEIAKNILQEILLRSPNHKMALLQNQFLHKNTTHSTFIYSKKYKNAAYQSLYLLLKASMSKNPVISRKLCQQSIKLKFSPEAAICIVENIFRGGGKISELLPYLNMVKKFPLDSATLFRNRYFVSMNLQKELLFAAKTVNKLTFKHKKIITLKIDTARIIEDKKTVEDICIKNYSKEIFHSCYKASLELNIDKLIKILMKKAAASSISKEIGKSYFNHSIEFAFSKITSNQLLPYESIQIAKLYLKAHRWEKAITLLKFSHGKSGETVDSKIALARGFIDSGLYSKGRKLIDSIIDSNLSHPPSLIKLGLLFLKMNKSDAANIIAKKISRSAPGGWRNKYLFAIMKMNQHNYKNVKDLLDQSIRVTQPNPDLYAAKARLLFHEGQYPTAIKFIEKAIDSDTGNPKWMVYLARLSHRYKQALYGKYYWKASNLYIKTDALRMASLILSEYDNTLDIRINIDEKNKVIQTLLKMKRLHPVAMVTLAKWFHNQDKKSALAIKYLKKAIAISPKSPTFRYMLATWLFLTNPLECKKELQSIIQAFGYHPIKSKAMNLLLNLNKTSDIRK